MNPTNRHFAGFLVVLAALAVLATSADVRAATTPEVAAGGLDNNSAVRVQVKPLPPGVSRLYLVSAPGGRRLFEMALIDGTVERLSPEEFADRLYVDQSEKPWAFRILNITSPVGFAWVFLGLLGQVLFTGRALLQWLVSEKAKRSVVPVGYWWMSLIGASMLLVYFIWRRDIIGVLGLTTGWLIYGRNLWLIYFPKGTEPAFDAQTGR